MEWILAAIDERAVDRHSYVLALGGGALLDVAGYAAAVAHRGVRVIRLPTTVLAQNDAGVGVKNGLNAYGKKNFLGTFAPPWAVIDDELFLTTLSARDWRAGTSEAVKVALLRDAAFFAELERLAPAVAERDLGAMRALIRRCAELHLAHIAGGGDPFEMGCARPLDFGHWSAHKLERLSWAAAPPRRGGRDRPRAGRHLRAPRRPAGLRRLAARARAARGLWPSSATPRSSRTRGCSMASTSFASTLGAGSRWCLCAPSGRPLRCTRSTGC